MFEKKNGELLELKLHRTVHFHQNILEFYGITKKDPAIQAGEREEVIDKTPIEYSNLYMDCWKGEPDERPSIQEVASALKSLKQRNFRYKQGLNNNKFH
ncbi:16526_t:CDS:2 [Funneliformis caledonium]|uniref:16526_t:CDS:1 n=1 Tax=Funneliformis caledonium TaxID=1117310 RepID=A0A9N8W5U2_9GLOM|nr:16526_t:CDS:2 [Funneliformis caledonium]